MESQNKKFEQHRAIKRDEYDTAKAKLDELSATQPQIPIRYPERSRRQYGYDEPNPAFTAAGIDLTTDEARHKAVEVFESSLGNMGEMQLIVAGQRDGEPITLIMHRELDFHSDGPTRTVVRRSMDTDGEMFGTTSLDFSEDGTTLNFNHTGYEKPEYTDFDQMSIEAMYLVPEVKNGTGINRDQLRTTRFSRAFSRLTKRAKQAVILS